MAVPGLPGFRLDPASIRRGNEITLGGARPRHGPDRHLRGPARARRRHHGAVPDQGRVRGTGRGRRRRSRAARGRSSTRSAPTAPSTSATCPARTTAPTSTSATRRPPARRSTSRRSPTRRRVRARRGAGSGVTLDRRRDAARRRQLPLLRDGQLRHGPGRRRLRRPRRHERRRRLADDGARLLEPRRDRDLHRPRPDGPPRRPGPGPGHRRRAAQRPRLHRRRRSSRRPARRSTSRASPTSRPSSRSPAIPAGSFALDAHAGAAAAVRRRHGHLRVPLLDEGHVHDRHAGAHVPRPSSSPTPTARQSNYTGASRATDFLVGDRRTPNIAYIDIQLAPAVGDKLIEATITDAAAELELGGAGAAGLGLAAGRARPARGHLRLPLLHHRHVGAGRGRRQAASAAPSRPTRPATTRWPAGRRTSRRRRRFTVQQLTADLDDPLAGGFVGSDDLGDRGYFDIDLHDPGLRRDARPRLGARRRPGVHGHAEGRHHRHDRADAARRWWSGPTHSPAQRHRPLLLHGHARQRPHRRRLHRRQRRPSGRGRTTRSRCSPTARSRSSTPIRRPTVQDFAVDVPFGTSALLDLAGIAARRHRDRRRDELDRPGRGHDARHAPRPGRPGTDLGRRRQARRPLQGHDPASATTTAVVEATRDSHRRQPHLHRRPLQQRRRRRRSNTTDDDLVGIDGTSSRSAARAAATSRSWPAPTPTILADGRTVRYYLTGTFAAGVVTVAFQRRLVGRRRGQRRASRARERFTVIERLQQAAPGSTPDRSSSSTSPAA